MNSTDNLFCNSNPNLSEGETRNDMSDSEQEFEFALSMYRSGSDRTIWFQYDDFMFNDLTDSQLQQLREFLKQMSLSLDIHHF